MFFDVLGIAFIVELLVGIMIGWSLASFFSGRRNSIEGIGGWGSAKGFPLDKPTDSEIRSMETETPKTNSDLATIQDALAWSEADLLRLKSENDTLRENSAKEQALRASLETQVGHYKNEVAKTLVLAKTLQAQVEFYKQEFAKAQALTKRGLSSIEMMKNKT